MKLRKNTREAIFGYLFILPNFLGFLAFIILPVIFALVASFTELKFTSNPSGLGFTMTFVGAENYASMWSDHWFIASMLNNLYFSLVKVPVTIVTALFCAIILNKYVFCKSAIRMMFFLPYIANIVVVSSVWFAMYMDTAPFTRIVKLLGVENPPYWLADTRWAMPAVIVVSVWAHLGYTMVIYLAGLQAIPQGLYEACEIDGANAVQKFIHITLPMLSPTTFFILITTIINSFKVFGQINVMTRGGPGTSTTVLVYYIYQAAFKFWKMGYASAMSWVLFIMIFAVTLIQWRGQKKWVSYM